MDRHPERITNVSFSPPRVSGLFHSLYLVFSNVPSMKSSISWLSKKKDIGTNSRGQDETTRSQMPVGIEYQNYQNYYDDPTVIEDVGVPSAGICGNQSTSGLLNNKFVVNFISDIRVATPRTSMFYVSSTTPSSSGNTTLYATAQCIENTTQTICQNCLNIAYNNLVDCLPNTEGRAIDLGCFMRYSGTPFFNKNQTTNITPFLREESSSKLGIIVAVATGAGMFLLIIVISLWYRLRKRSKALEEGGIFTFILIHYHELDSSELQGVVNFSYKDMQLATGNFSEEHRIGKGGFGEVYKAIIDDNNVVAVKKLLVQHGKARVVFDNEVKLMSSVRHRNLVRVLGWSSEGPELLLVLEYMSKGSLDKFLWGEAKGNFGLARFQVEDQSHVSTKFAGTLGYTAPEYATHGHLSEKVDTYSFGIVSLEIISGRRCNDVKSQSSDVHYLLDDAWKFYENNMHLKVVDENLDLTESEQEHVKKIIEISLTCTQSPVGLRPTMSEVMLMLSNETSLVRRKVGNKSAFIAVDKDD
ncbi:hypothetical protein L2E82_43427 [Cichorium intybus]|uniref:Uncharacterized protein n=1 Tax=Cichorium intybus TaxID=13427 RepID=A0ACB8ZPK9_CICIN|nr:hypothetical protein L2E82_43427 [Cichorium intybus]